MKQAPHLILAALLSLAAPVIGSDTMSQAFNFSGSWTEDQYDINGNFISSGNYAGAVTNNFTYSLFDSSLGTLNSVELSVHIIGAGDSMIDYYNWSGISGLPTITVTNNQGIDFNLTGTHDGWLDGSYVPIVQNQSIFGTQSATVSAPNAPGTWVMSPDNYSTANFDTTLVWDASANLSNWIGSGTSNGYFQNWISQFASYSTSPPGGTNNTSDGAINTHWESQDWNAEVTVKYNYLAVPEPGSGLTALLGLGLFLRRRRR